MEDAELNDFESEIEFYYRTNQQRELEDIRTMIGEGHLMNERLGLQSTQTPAMGENELGAQLALLMKERDSLHVLWQSSQKTIEALENELKTYQSYGDRGQQAMNENKRDIELKLETSLTDYIELEAKYKAIQSKLSTSEQEVKHKNKEIISLKERISELEEKINELTKSIEESRIELGAEKKNNEDLKSQLKLCQKEIVERVKKEAEAKAKVAEALHLFDVVTSQKNEANKKVGEITAQLAKLNQALENSKRDAEKSYRAELDDLRNKYNEKITDMLTHIRNLDSELVEKGMLLNKAMREIKVLKHENECLLKQQKDSLKAVEPRLKIAEQRMETMFQELVASERRNIQLGCEKQCLAIEMQRVQDMHSREIKRRDWEEGLLRTQCQELKSQVEHLQKSLEETHGMVNRLQKMLSSRTELNEKILTTKEEELLELNKHLENQMELSRKWKESYVEMTEKLKKNLEDLHEENKALRAQLNGEQLSDQDNNSL